MSNDGKKIAFSFSKVKKPTLVNKVNIEPKDKIEYVDCFDGSKGKFSYKGSIRNDESQKRELVIPMPTSRTSTDIIKSRIQEKKNKNLELNEIVDAKKNSNTENESKSIEELAALEILNEVKNANGENKTDSTLIIESKDLPEEAGETDIDYDNIPVTDFGLAMLRGMGWRPELGIGKDPRLVETSSPKLRPKGLGLGAQITIEADSEKKEEKEKKITSSDKKVKKT